MGAGETTNRNITMGLSCSADSIQMKLSQINSTAVVPAGWVMGRSAAIITSWEMKMRWFNVSNQILKVTLYTIRLKQDIPPVWYALNLGGTGDILTLLEQMFDDQYNNSVNSNRTIGHMAFKLTDVAAFKRYFKISRVSTFVLQPGQEKTMIKFRRKPEYINTAKFFQPGVGFTTVGKKGNREYMWRVHSTTLESKDAGSAARVTPAYNFQASYHYRVRYLANDEYNFQPPAVPISGITPHTIFPGTSTVGDLAPAT